MKSSTFKQLLGFSLALALLCTVAPAFAAKGDSWPDNFKPSFGSSEDPLPKAGSDEYDDLLKEGLAKCGKNCTEEEVAKELDDQIEAEQAARAAAQALEDQLAQAYADQMNSPNFKADERIITALESSSEHLEGPPEPCPNPFGCAERTSCSKQIGGDGQSHSHCVAVATTGIKYDADESSRIYSTTDASSLCDFEISCSGHRENHGCFAPNTTILMGDKTLKSVELVQAGDFVWNPIANKAVKVSRLISGPEYLPLIEIGYADKKVKVTTLHPMAVPMNSDKGGLVNSTLSTNNSALPAIPIKAVLASELSVGDEVVGEDGVVHRIETLRQLPIDEEQIVYNIELDAPEVSLKERAIIADGFVTGDYLLQKKLGEALVH